MHNNAPVRSSGFIWCVRILQAIFAITLLGITVSNASNWHSLDCTTPTKLAYHIAMAAITLFPIAYFLLFTGPVSLTRFWSPWVQITLDALFVIFWIVAAALSSYDCAGLCSSCSAGGEEVDIGYGFTVWVGSLSCGCVFSDDIGGSYYRKLFRRGSGSIVVKTAEKASSIAAKQGLDGSMIFLFLVTLLTTIFLKYGSSTAHTQAAANNNAGREEAKIGDDSGMNEAQSNAQDGNVGKG